MGLFFLDSDLGQNLKDRAGLDFQLPRQLVDPNFLCLISQDRSHSLTAIPSSPPPSFPPSACCWEASDSICEGGRPASAG
jgi:hypothetical protein